MISPTRNELLTSLVNYIAAATGLETSVIIRSKQNAPSPLNSYCSILYVTDATNGTANIDINDIVGDDTIVNYAMRGKRNYTFSVQFYRDNATDFAKLVLMFHQTPAGQEFQFLSPFIVSKVAMVQEAGAVISNNYEERAVVTMELGVNETQTLTVNTIAEAPVNLEFQGNSDITESFEVNDNG